MDLYELVKEKIPGIARVIETDSKYRHELAGKDIIATNIKGVWVGFMAFTEDIHISVARAHFSWEGERGSAIIKTLPRARSSYNKSSAELRNYGWTTYKEFEVLLPKNKVNNTFMGMMMFLNPHERGIPNQYCNPVSMWINTVDAPSCVVHSSRAGGEAKVKAALEAARNDIKLWRDPRDAAAKWHYIGRGMSSSGLGVLTKSVNSVYSDKAAERSVKVDMDAERLLLEALGHDEAFVYQDWVTNQIDQGYHMEYGVLRWLWFDEKLRARALNYQKCRVMKLCLKENL